MNREQIIRAWKDSEYRAGLSEAERSLLPEHPAGIVELPDELMGVVAGAEESSTSRLLSIGCCQTPNGGTVKFFSVGCACGEQAT
ncbi:MAG TPA: mersacidin/lichenicidin family type 2 lantibiotic [Pyrinomonadaceae bacterium]|jgi:mersacidin/lichenicidin family type 2 lantibiotic